LGRRFIDRPKSLRHFATRVGKCKPETIPANVRLLLPPPQSRGFSLSQEPRVFSAAAEDLGLIRSRSARETRDSIRARIEVKWLP
jgi:hypothetical protein